MNPALERFRDEARTALAGDSGPRGREAVARRLETLPEDRRFAAARPGNESGRLHEDPDFGFRVLARRGPSSTRRRGPSRAVCGMNFVDMTEWKRVDDGSRESRAELAAHAKYRLEEGKARVCDEGVILSLDRPTRLARVTGCDLGKILRCRYDPGRNAAKALRPKDRS